MEDWRSSSSSSSSSSGSWLSIFSQSDFARSLSPGRAYLGFPRALHSEMLQGMPLRNPKFATAINSSSSGSVVTLVVEVVGSQVT